MIQYLNKLKNHARGIACLTSFLLIVTIPAAQVVTQQKSSPTNTASQTEFSGSINRTIVSSNCFIPRDATYIAVPRNDNGSLGPITLPFTYSLYGTNYTRVWINTNGNLTFEEPLSGDNPAGFPIGVAMLAPFWADADTRNPAGGQIYYKLSPTRLIVTWDSVGYFSSQADKLNTFQVVLTNGIDPILTSGNNTAFYYKDMQWTTGASGFGGVPATAGINRGNPTFSIQIGRFNLNNSDYDGPQGANDGVNYLDNKCFLFDAARICIAEICNGVDDDCDDLIDEDCNVYYFDSDKDGYGGSDNVISTMSRFLPSGYISRGGDCNDADASINPGATEICNFKDDDCDGTVDEGCAVYYRDADGDGYGLWDQQIRAMSPPAGYTSVGGDCNDADLSIHPGAMEVCNGLDDNCNGSIDESCVSGSAAGRNAQPTERKSAIEPFEFKITAYPNPSDNLFNLQLEGDGSKGKITVRVYNYLGRLVEVKDNLSVGQLIKIGAGYSNGAYVLEATQGRNKISTKITKL
jgi:hypothetical protein